MQKADNSCLGANQLLYERGLRSNRLGVKLSGFISCGFDEDKMQSAFL